MGDHLGTLGPKSTNSCFLGQIQRNQLFWSKPSCFVQNQPKPDFPIEKQVFSAKIDENHFLGKFTGHGPLTYPHDCLVDAGTGMRTGMGMETGMGMGMEIGMGMGMEMRCRCG